MRMLIYRAAGQLNRRIPTKWITMSLILLIVLPYPAKAQSSANYTVDANIIYRFTKYIDWPDDRKSGDFVIGLVGDTPLYDELVKMMAGKTAGNQRIVIRKLSVSQVSASCHILFVTAEESGSMKRIAAKTAGMPVLLVSEEEGMARKGSCINFTVVAEHLVLEINKENIDLRHLNIASDLVRLGKIVQ
jgi:hypothetical protein